MNKVERQERAPSAPVEPQDSPGMGELLAGVGGWRELRRGEIVKGVVMHVDHERILVNIGGKSEGVVPLREIQTLPAEAKSRMDVGDTLSLYMLQPEGPQGVALLSYDRARGELGWTKLVEGLESSQSVEAIVTGSNRGGLLVDVEGIQGFIPLSQLAPPSRSLIQAHNDGPQTDNLKATLFVKVLELDRRRNRVVLSEKAAWQERREEQKNQLMSQLSEGQTWKGRVTRLCPFGAFVDLGGAEGLIHVSELSWQPVESPDKVLKEGQEIEVYILKVDSQAGRIALSIRRLQPHPWESIGSSYHEGQLVPAKITRLVSFGAFARVEAGIEGLIHLSELSSKPISQPHQTVKEGDTVTVKVLRIDPERRRLGLSLKQAVEELGGEVTSPSAGAAAPEKD